MVHSFVSCGRQEDVAALDIQTYTYSCMFLYNICKSYTQMPLFRSFVARDHCSATQEELKLLFNVHDIPAVMYVGKVSHYLTTKRNSSKN